MQFLKVYNVMTTYVCIHCEMITIFKLISTSITFLWMGVWWEYLRFTLLTSEGLSSPAKCKNNWPGSIFVGECG